jgi:hypothetical protein
VAKEENIQAKECSSIYWADFCVRVLLFMCEIQSLSDMMPSLDSDTDVIVYTEDEHQESGKEIDSCVLVRYPVAQE